jgi:hypothetical protein
MAHDLRAHAKRIEALHKGDPNSTHYSHAAEYVGLKGEEAFANWSGVDMDMMLRPRGDGGKDFVISGKRIGVRTARKPTYLIVEPKEVHKSDIWVLVRYEDASDRATCLGWRYGAELARRPTRDIGGYGRIVHFIARGDLYSMNSLAELLREVSSNE